MSERVPTTDPTVVVASATPSPVMLYSGGEEVVIRAVTTRDTYGWT